MEESVIPRMFHGDDSVSLCLIDVAVLQPHRGYICRRKSRMCTALPSDERSAG